MSAYAPYNTNYGLTLTRPYLTVTEYQNAPTAVDTANLLPTDSVAEQSTALAEVIARASSMIDQECFGAWGTLCATVDVENARLWGRQDGSFVVHPKFWPIVEVQSFTYGATPGTAASITPAGNVWVEPSQFVVTPSGVTGLGLNALAGIASGFQYYCTWSYVSGFVNTALSASVASGSASVTVDDTTAIYPGSSLAVFDLPNDELVTVGASYVPGTHPVTLAAPLAYNHDVDVAVSNLPRAAKQAAISLTTVLVKVRGSGALVVNDIGEVRQAATNNPQGAADDLAIFERCIKALRQPYVGY